MPRINHNIPSLMTTNTLHKTEAILEKTIEHLSTGQRINFAYDDAAGYSVSEQLRSEIKGVTIGNRNIENGKALLDIAHGAITEVESILNRVRDLAVQSANKTLTDQDRIFIQQEVDQLLGTVLEPTGGELNRIANSTQYNGINLIDGSAPWGSLTGGKLHIGPGNDINADILRIKLPDMSAGPAGLNLIGNIDVSNQIDAQTAIGTIDQAIFDINKGLADIGAYANRLTHALANQESILHNMTAADSIIRDADIATETAEYTKLQVLQKSAVSVLAQANSFPKDILSLLKIG